jgi:hypothetical protein
MQSTTQSPENTSKLPVILEVLFLLGLVAAMCLLPAEEPKASEPLAAHASK